MGDFETVLIPIAEEDWMGGNSSTQPDPEPLMPHTSSSPRRSSTARTYSSAIKVHRGFWEYYSSVREEIRDTVRKLLDARRQSMLSRDKSENSSGVPLYRSKNEFAPGIMPEVCVTGHSLGGALSVLMAIDLEMNGIAENVTIYNFGCPRVGNHAFADFCGRMLPNMFRVVTDGDMAAGMLKHTHFMPWLPRYKHSGRLVIIDPKGSGKMVVCPTQVEKYLLAKRNRKVDPHRTLNYKNAL